MACAALLCSAGTRGSVWSGYLNCRVASPRSCLPASLGSHGRPRRTMGPRATTSASNSRRSRRRSGCSARSCSNSACFIANDGVEQHWLESCTLQASVRPAPKRSGARGEVHGGARQEAQDHVGSVAAQRPPYNHCPHIPLLKSIERVHGSTTHFWIGRVPERKLFISWTSVKESARTLPWKWAVCTASSQEMASKVPLGFTIRVTTRSTTWRAGST